MQMIKQNEIPMIAIRLSSLSDSQINWLKETIKDHKKNSNCFDSIFLCHMNLPIDENRSVMKWYTDITVSPFRRTRIVSFEQFKEFIDSN